MFPQRLLGLLTPAFVSLVAISHVNAQVQQKRIVLWNAQGLFSVNAVNTTRATDLQDFGNHFSDADIVILDEITSLAVVNAVRDKMGFTGFHTACSDFSQNDDNQFGSLEVGIISRFPLTNVLEFDQTTDNTGQPGEPAEQQLVVPIVPGIASVNTARGFLTADVPALGLTIAATHLKSSRGASPGLADHSNAQKREAVAAAMARFVATKRTSDTNSTVLVAGDLNIGETDKKKIGFNLNDDFTGSGNTYDETHAIFSAGLIDGLHMTSLTKGIGSETYDDPQFAGSGPIDCIYVVGHQAGDFTIAKKTTETFGSDHFSVSARFLFSGTAPPPAPGGGGVPITSTVRIAGLLPNPNGSDPGNENVRLRNTGSAGVDVAGWTLSDEANNTVSLAGTIAAGADLIINLGAGQMPLNNGGDEIELQNDSGQLVHIVSYLGSDVSPGVEIVVSN
jgi:endonuclease/exonuclease/phosphatase family metal-dependent hydrolase